MAKNRGFWIKHFFTVIAILSVILFLDFIKPILIADVFPIIVHIDICCLAVLIPTFSLSFYNDKLDRPTGLNGKMISDRYIFIVLAIVFIFEIFIFVQFYHVLYDKLLYFYVDMALLPGIGGLVSLIVLYIITGTFIIVYVWCFKHRLGKKVAKYIFPFAY